MVGMAPYPMDGHGGAPQAMMMMQGGVPGGYVMVQPGMQGMMVRPMMPGAGQDGQGQGMGLPPNVQLMMVQPGMGGMPPNMQMAMSPPQPGHGHSGQDGQNPGMMMMTGPGAGGMQGAAQGPGPMGQACGQMGQGGMMGQAGLMDADGKGGSRVAALSRSSQPKQGAGGWHGSGDRRGGRPPVAGQGMRDFDAGMYMDQQGHPGQFQQGASGSGGGGPGPMPQGASASGPGPSGDAGVAAKATRMANPKNPWADFSDAPNGGLDQDTRQMWSVGPGGQSSRMGGTPPQRGQPAPKQMQAHPGAVQGGPSSPPGRKAGRDAGKGGGDDKKGGRGPPQDAQAQKWVEVGRPVEPSPAGGKGQGKGHQDNRWEPKEIAPKAPSPVPHMAAPPMAAPPAKGAGGPGMSTAAAAAEAAAGGKKKTRRDQKMDDWLSQRFAGLESKPSVSESTAAAPREAEAAPWNDHGDFEEDYGGDDGDRRGKKKGGKGGCGGGASKGAGKADDRRRDKGKGGKGGKGKGGGGGSFWQRTQG